MWTAIALISISAIFAGIFTDRGKRRHNTEVVKELKALKDKVEALDNDLRDRVETLERIVTNPKEDLKRQFDNLDKSH